MRKQVSHLGILGGILVGEAPENIPIGSDAALLGPFEELNVLDSTDAFLHLLQYSGAEALDARLDILHAGGTELIELFTPADSLWFQKTVRPRAVPVQALGGTF